MMMKSKFMIKYLWILLIIGLTGCHTEPQFADPIDPTENKTETIKNWMSDFDSYILYSYDYENKIYIPPNDDSYDTRNELYIETYNNYYKGFNMPFNFYGPILPYSLNPILPFFLQNRKWICAPQPSNYPKSVINHKSTTKKSVMVFGYNRYYDEIVVEVGNEIKEQCHKAHETIKNQYIAFIQDNIIDENEYKQLNNVYLQERNKVINTIKTINKLAMEDTLKEEAQEKMQEIQKKQLEEDNNKNGVGVIK